ncbi:MAG: DeoR/GlpR family DNA-binding transcription regulator [Pseudomonadales bacterium]
MKLNPRQQRILEEINTQTFVSVEYLSQLFDVAAQTIRRDITQLCDLGLARRHHGGAGPLPSAQNISFGARQVLNAGAKRAIAREIAAAIPDNASIAMGIGTTVEAVARELQEHRGLKILTNNLNVASQFFSSSHTQVLVSGGALRPQDQDMVGQSVVEFFNSYHCDYAIIGVGALDSQRGLMDYDTDNVQITQSILQNAAKCWLAVDASKWSKKAFANVAPLRAVHRVFSDSLPESEIIDRAEAAGTIFTICHEEHL